MKDKYANKENQDVEQTQEMWTKNKDIKMLEREFIEATEDLTNRIDYYRKHYVKLLSIIIKNN